MPQRRDPVATRKKLLTAARLEFARHGFAGARVDEIAERAGVNKQLVYHYFGDKDALYLAVLEWVYEDIREQERRLNLEGLPPDKAIRKLIEASFDHLAENPDFIVLLNDENRGGARHVRGSTRLEAMHSPLVKSVSHILHEGVRAGMFRKESTRSSSTSPSRASAISSSLTRRRCRRSSARTCRAAPPSAPAGGMSPIWCCSRSGRNQPIG